MHSFKNNSSTELRRKCPVFYNEEHTKQSVDLNCHAVKQNGSQRCNCGVLINTYNLTSYLTFLNFQAANN